MSIRLQKEGYRVILGTDDIREMSSNTTIQLDKKTSVTNGMIIEEFMHGLCTHITIEQFVLYMRWYLAIVRLVITATDLTISVGNWIISSGSIIYCNTMHIKPYCDFRLTRDERGDVLVVVMIDGQPESYRMSQIIGLVAMSMVMDDNVLY